MSFMSGPFVTTRKTQPVSTQGGYLYRLCAQESFHQHRSLIVSPCVYYFKIDKIDKIDR